MRRAVLAILALCLPGSALAAGADGPCLALMKQQDMNACIADAFRKADGVLNSVYGELDRKLDPSGHRNLVAAERAWITFRDAECNLRSGFDAEHPENNGTIAPFLIGQCRLDLTEQRTGDLRKQVKCQGGDLSCSP